MTDSDFVKNIEIEILDKMFNRYFNTMKTIDRSLVNDPYWKKILILYDTLDINGKENLKALVRLVMIDLVSSIFAKLDGISSFENQIHQFDLRYGETTISGDLQEIFLMDIEDEDGKSMFL